MNLLGIFYQFKLKFMLIILSPAKTMDMKTSGEACLSTYPLFQQDADLLVGKMKQYGVEELQKLLKISKSLAEENYNRYQKFDQSDTLMKQALFAYNGSVFKNMQTATIPMTDLGYIQEHLRIVSVLYGLLRPLDLIKAYRLDYTLKLKGMNLKNLYEYWFPKLTKSLIGDVKRSGGVLINLASLDVWGAFDGKEIRKQVRVITPEFQEWRNGKYEMIRTYAKQARGAMTRYVLLHRLETPEEIIRFEWDGFQFNEEISDSERYIFTRAR